MNGHYSCNEEVVIATSYSMIDQQLPTTTVLELDSYWPYHVTVLADRIARRTTSIVKQHRAKIYRSGVCLLR